MPPSLRSGGQPNRAARLNVRPPFLGFVFFLILLFVAGAFAIYQWGGDVLVKQAVPKGHFEAAAAGSGPDYAAGVELAGPPGMRRMTLARGCPMALPPDTKGNAAIFYIHPTTYLERDRWNAPLHAVGETAFRTNLFLQSQASAFNGAGQIWAPRYRQAAYRRVPAEERGRAEGAGLRLWRRRRRVRPVRQGGAATGRSSSPATARERCTWSGCCAKRSPASRSRDASLRPTSSAGRSARPADLPALGLPACARAGSDRLHPVLDELRRTRQPDLDPRSNGRRRTGLTGGERRQRGHAVRQSDHRARRTAPRLPQEIPGRSFRRRTCASATLEPGLVGARCDKGLLILDGAIPPLGPFVLPGNNYHVYDYALFWGAIRRDAAAEACGMAALITPAPRNSLPLSRVAASSPASMSARRRSASRSAMPAGTSPGRPKPSAAPSSPQDLQALRGIHRSASMSSAWSSACRSTWTAATARAPSRCAPSPATSPRSSCRCCCGTSAGRPRRSNGR